MEHGTEFTFELSEIDRVAKEFLKLCENRFFFAFYGTLGAGKTTFIKSFCKSLGCEDNVVSPTYSLVNEYHANHNNNIFTIYHMDFYRLNNVVEAIDLGVDEYFDKQDAYCLVEWPELVEGLLPQNTVKVKIERAIEDKRTLRIL